RVRRLRVRNAAVAALVLCAAILAIFTGATAGLEAVMKPGKPVPDASQRGLSGKRPEIGKGPGNPSKETDFRLDGDPRGTPIDVGAGTDPDASGFGEDQSVPENRSKPFEDLRLLIVLAVAGAIVAILIIMKSWRRAPPKTDEDEEEDEEVVPAVVVPAL